MKHADFIYPTDSTKGLKDFNPSFSGKYKSKKSAEKDLEKGIEQLSVMQDMLYAHDRYAVLIIFQAMDAAGKDGTVKHVMSGINPQGCQVTSFKVPSAEELDHDYLWRCVKQLPERGRIGIFNRSYYEEVLVTRVHPQILQNEKLPGLPKAPENDRKFWKQRFDDINNFEKFLTNQGTIILKFFLHVSPEEQKKRLLERIDDPSKNWKFSTGDVNERALWPKYMEAYEEILKHTSTEVAPWYVIPADKKWFMRAAVCDVIVERMQQLKLHYPLLNDTQKADLLKAKEMLENENTEK
ncbi:MAG TPA: polyphosphate kinase 2 family protein [Bacteroidales bacterium]|nr:polyphosphate kinase 2 family protein [Bacteroidales bacterium]HPT02921.1 polyphosphate kinase 2 family protein [Bacteroidales bacterium]